MDVTTRRFARKYQVEIGKLAGDMGDGVAVPYHQFTRGDLVSNECGDLISLWPAVSAWRPDVLSLS